VPIFRISVVNHTLTAQNEQDVPSLDEARKQGIKAAIAIGSDEIANGKAFFGAEVLVQDGEGTTERLIVAIGTSPLR
jgi:hypothetical protein